MDGGRKGMSHIMAGREDSWEATKAALLASEERFRTLIECSPLPIVIARDGKFIYVNPAYCRMVGAPRPLR